MAFSTSSRGSFATYGGVRHSMFRLQFVFVCQGTNYASERCRMNSYEFEESESFVLVWGRFPHRAQQRLQIPARYWYYHSVVRKSSFSGKNGAEIAAMVNGANVTTMENPSAEFDRDFSWWAGCGSSHLD